MPSCQPVDGNFFVVASLAAIECKKPGCYRYINNKMAYSSLGVLDCRVPVSCSCVSFCLWDFVL